MTLRHRLPRRLALAWFAGAWMVATPAAAIDSLD
jgi:hypothetical protein